MICLVGESLAPLTELSKLTGRTVSTPYPVQVYRSFTAPYPKKLNSEEGEGGGGRGRVFHGTNK